MTLHRQAAKIASKGRKGDSVLVHMTPKEVAGLQSLALSVHGKPLTVNPKTGLVEANSLKKYIGPLVGAIAGGMGWSTTTASVLGGIANGLANGMTLRNVGLGALSAGTARDMANDINNPQVVAAPTSAQGTPAIAPAPKSTLLPNGIRGPISNPMETAFAVPPAATPTLAETSKTVQEQVKQTPTAQPTVLDRFKTLGTNAIKTFNDPKASKEFVDNHKLQALAMMAAASATTQRAPKNGGEAPMQRWDTQWEPGVVNPNYGKYAGEPYYLPNTRGFKNGHWTTTPYGTVEPTDTASYAANPQAYRFLHPIAAARGGYFATGGDVHTEQPVKEAPVVAATGTPVPATPDPRLTYSSPFTGATYQSPYASDLDAYLNNLNTSLHPIAKAAGTGTGTGTGGGGGGGVGPGGGGGGPGGTNIADEREPMGGENVGYPVDATGPGMPIVNPRTDRSPGDRAETGGAGFSVGPGGMGFISSPTRSPLRGDASFVSDPSTGLRTDGSTASGTRTSTTPTTPSNPSNPSTPNNGLWNGIKNAAHLVVDAFGVPRYITSQVANAAINAGGKALGIPQSILNKTQLLVDLGMGQITSWTELKQAAADWKADEHTQQENDAFNKLKKLLADEEAKEEAKQENKEAAADRVEQSGAGQRGSSLTTRNSFDVTSPFFQLGQRGTDQRVYDPDTGVRYSAHGGMLGHGYGYAGGGGIGSLGSYSDGGRFLKGPGDGVSDDIPGVIHHPDGNQQPARLATGEFVFPARIVSEIGNGSSDAGAQKLYNIMDKIQNDRRRTIKNVALDSDAERHFNGLMA